MAIAPQHPPIVRDETFGKDCEIETACLNGVWCIIFGRHGKEVFRVPLDNFAENIIDLAEAVFHTAEDDIHDFINAEKTDGIGNNVLAYLQKMVETGRLKVAKHDHERQLVRTLESDVNGNDGRIWSVLKTYRGREVLRVKHSCPLWWPDHLAVSELIDKLGPYFDAFVNAKVNKDYGLGMEICLLKYEHNRQRYIGDFMTGLIEHNKKQSDSQNYESCSPPFSPGQLECCT